MKRLILAALLCLSASAQTTTWFAATNPFIVPGGVNTIGTIGGRASMILTGVNGEAQFGATGSAISLSVYPTSASGCTFTVNGTPSTPTLTANTWQVVSIYSGADQLNTIQISGSVNTCYFDDRAVTGSTGFVEVTGASPSLSYWSNYGPFEYINTTPQPANVSTDGTMYVNSASTGLYSSGSNDAQLRFRATCSDLWGWIFQATNQYYNLFVNQVPSASVNESGAGWGWLHLATGLNASAEAEYMLTFPQGSTQGFVEIMCGGGTINNSYLPPHPSYVAFGDSITQATGGNFSQDSTYGYPRLTGQGLSYGNLNFGVNGAHVVGASGSALDFRTYDITSQSKANGASVGSGQAPSVVSILGGVNDIGSVTAAVFQASYQDMLYKLVWGMPSSTTFYCWDILDTLSDLPTVVAPYRAAIAQAVASMQSPHVIHVPTAGWWYANIQATAIGAGLHPNPSGYATIEQKWLPTVKQAPWIPVAAMGW